MGETTGRLCLKKLIAVVSGSATLRAQFFRKMTRRDARIAMELHFEGYGVEGMLGALDCMHIFWKNCPIAWQGQFSGKTSMPSIVLEAFGDFNLFVWHGAFGWAGSMNDISIWDRSPLLQSFLDGSFSGDVDFSFQIGDCSFSKLWLLVDGIYPEIARFVKTCSVPIGCKQQV